MITACMIVFNEEDHIGYTLRNIYECSEWINQIIIIEGVIKTLHPFATKDGASTDKTMDVIPDTIKKYGRDDVEVTIQRGLWESKSHMRNEYLKHVTNDHIMLWDADEYYRVGDIKFISDLIKKQNVDCIMYPFIHFHHDFKHFGFGKHWEGTQLRFSRFKKGYSYRKHFTLSDNLGRLIQYDDFYNGSRFFAKNTINSRYKRVNLSLKGTILDKDIWIYHLGYVKKADDIAMKLALYQKRDKRKKGSIIDLAKENRKNNGMFDKRLEFGVNPDSNGIRLYTGDYPEILKQHKWFDKLKIKYESIEEYEKENGVLKLD